jgi:prophage regulatory protein
MKNYSLDNRGNKALSQPKHHPISTDSDIPRKRPKDYDTPLGEQVGKMYLRLKEVQRMVPFSAKTIWRKSKDGSFVRPVKLSSRITAWNRESVEEWLKNKEAK